MPASRGHPLGLGIDLAGAPHRSTGVCDLGPDLSARTRVLHTDAEIEAWVAGFPDAPVVIDAPLSLPVGRPSLEARGPPHFRQCDRELRARGIPFFPITLGPMRMLTARGIGLAVRLRAQGREVLEGYPGAVQDLLGWPRKGDGVERLRRAMRRSGLGGSVASRRTTHDELDAVACALTSLAWRGLLGTTVTLGDPNEGQIVLLASLARAPRGGTAGPRSAPVGRR